MKRIASMLALLAGLASLPALSQQLNQPTVPASKPAPPASSGVGPSLQQPQTAAPKVATDPAQRPQAPASIPSKGPAQEVPTGSTAPAASKRPASVLDSTGKPVDGMIQVAPNRVLDPATGRYYWTEPAGQGQKLLRK